MTSSAIGRLGWIQVDCEDPARLAEFWARMLATDVLGRLGDPPHYVTLNSPQAGAPRIAFQRVPERKTGKNRLHFDIAVTDLPAAIEQAVSLGASPTADGDFVEYGIRWTVMRDPEGNEFCLVQDESGPGG
jgi:predicted enzyme related to lactoylglutathione lyase